MNSWPTSPRSAGSTSPSTATTSGPPCLSRTASGLSEIPAHPSSMPLSVGFRETRAMTPGGRLRRDARHLNAGAKAACVGIYSSALGRRDMQPSRPADPLAFRGTVNSLQKRGVEPHIDGGFPRLLFGNRGDRGSGQPGSGNEGCGLLFGISWLYAVAHLDSHCPPFVYTGHPQRIVARQPPWRAPFGNCSVTVSPLLNAFGKAFRLRHAHA